jgi:hypothetical protein
MTGSVLLVRCGVGVPGVPPVRGELETGVTA